MDTTPHDVILYSLHHLVTFFYPLKFSANNFQLITICFRKTEFSLYNWATISLHWMAAKLISSMCSFRLKINISHKIQLEIKYSLTVAKADKNLCSEHRARAGLTLDYFPVPNCVYSPPSVRFAKKGGGLFSVRLESDSQ